MIRTSIHIDASPDSIFAVLEHAERFADWVVGAKRIRHADTTFPRPGAQLDHTLGVFGLDVKDATEVIRSEKSRVLELDARARQFRAIVRFELSPDATGTTVVMEEEGANALSRSLVRMMRPVFLARNAETLWRLRTQVANCAEPSQRTPSGAEPRALVPRWLGDTTARVFGLATALRGSRAIHSKGITRRGTARITESGSALAEQPTADAIVRFSRAVGLPARIPDVNGLAVRLVDAHGPGRHRDLLFAATGPGLLRRVIVPAVDFGASSFSTILGYRLDDEPVVLTAEVKPRGLTFDRLSVPDAVEIRLYADSDKSLGTVVVGELMDGSCVRFDPATGTTNLLPVGVLNALRPPAYAASQAVRGG